MILAGELELFPRGGWVGYSGGYEKQEPGPGGADVTEEKQLSQRIRDTRIKLMWPQTVLARKLGVTQPAVCKWERGYPVGPQHLPNVIKFLEENHG